MPERAESAAREYLSREDLYLSDTVTTNSLKACSGVDSLPSHGRSHSEFDGSDTSKTD